MIRINVTFTPNKTGLDFYYSHIYARFFVVCFFTKVSLPAHTMPERKAVGNLLDTNNPPDCYPCSS